MIASLRRLGLCAAVWTCGAWSDLHAQAPAAGSPPPLDHAHGAPAGPRVDVGLVLLTAVGASTARDPVLADLQAGAHDPAQRGFTFQQAELSFAGDLEDWASARAYLVAAIEPESGETIVELEEAFVQSRGLPHRLQVRAGTFFTEFGRVNASHPHQWDWQDQPVMHSRVFGGDGMRGPGVRLSWQLPVPASSELLASVQNAHGETMPSFLANDEVYAERGIGGRSRASGEVRSGSDVVWLVRASARFGEDDGANLELGASVLFGPNPTGDGADTFVYGADCLWRTGAAAGRGGAGVLTVRGELLARAFDAAAQVDASDPGNPVALGADTLHDVGGHLQGLYGLASDWAAGVRIELAAGSGASYRGGGVFDRSRDPFRADRLQVSPLLQWRPASTCRLRLQYDYDDSDHLAGAQHSVWLGLEVTLGGHASPGHVH